MIEKPIQVLLVEDNPGDARLIQEHLADAGATYFKMETAQTLANALEKCSRPEIDVALLDLGLPDSVGLDTLKAFQSCATELPVVVLSGLNDEKIAIQAVQLGAQDYLIKGEINGALIARSLRYAIERKRSETIVKAERQRLYQVLETLPVHVALLTKDHHVSFANKSFRKQFGESHGRHCFEYLFNRTGPCENCETYEVLKTNTSHNWIWTGPDGRNYDTHDFPFTDSDGSQMIMEMGIDITERKKAEEDLRDANMRLQKSLNELALTQQKVIQQERLSALGQMASGIAHDFNNVLMPIMGFSELLLSDPSALDDRKESRHMIEMILSAGKDARQIVRRMRTVYRKDNDTKYEMVDISRIIESAISLTMPKWKEELNAKGITIEMVTEFHSVPQINGNEREIRESLVNLIFNAVDAMPKGGVITFRVFRKNDISIVLEVTDTGIGMDQETLQHSMEPFFTTKGTQGSGLGLSMVYGIVERHDGVVEIESKPNIGTTIRMVFPVPVEARKINKELEEASKPLSPLRILVIDDEARSRNLIAKLLQADAHHIEIAEDGKGGLNMLRQGEFDLVITDRAMPIMNGDDVAKEAHQIRPGIPIIMLTGFGDIMKDGNECPPGVTRVMSKPVTSKDLRSVMASVMRKPEEKLLA